MPLASLRPCLRCRKLNQGKSYCEACKPRDERVGSYAQRSGVPRAQWDMLRKEYLRLNPCCATCLAEKKRRERANVVDHIVPHKGDLKLFFDWSNLQGLCFRCHNRKTAKQDGGFGR